MRIRCFGFVCCLAGLLYAAPGIFARVPLEDESLHGAAAAQARLRLLKTAESFLGTPYLYAGFDRRGLDCSGFVSLSFKEGLNFSIPRSSGGIYAWAEKIATADLQPGDLVFFVTVGQKVSHLGIYSGGGRFIHAASDGAKTGVIYSRLDESYWKAAYKGAGRALPWDAEAALAMEAAVKGAAANSGPESGRPAERPLLTLPGSGGPAQKNPAERPSPLPGVAGGPGPSWEDTGFFTGFGSAWTWGGLGAGASRAFRGFSAVAAAGYKWSSYRASLEIRPEPDFALGVVRLPFTLSVGTDIFQVFAGPAYTFGTPSLRLKDSERRYSGGGSWRWEAGISAALPPVKIQRGALSFYSELAWQPYHWENGSNFQFGPDITANLRFSTGLRYLWMLNL